MTIERERMQNVAPMLRNTPMRARQWSDLMDRDDIALTESESGQLLVVPQNGQLNLHYAVTSEEAGRQGFAGMFAEIEDSIEEAGWSYTRIDLVELPNRLWIEALLRDAGFRPFGEWMDMEKRDMHVDAPPPEIPEALTMRRGNDDDHDAVVAMEAAAYDEDSVGEQATRMQLEEAAWLGILEQGGESVAYAINDHAAGAQARILSAAVDPEHRGAGLGQVILGAAAYQIASQEATLAVVRVNPLIGPAVRTATAAGFRGGRRGIEFRRPTDADARRQVEQSERVTGVKARFGDWR